MSGKHWKLVITSLSGGAIQREVAVVGDNWLSALRAARKTFGEDGAVPPGASCVMSASGEVTILDAAQRLRYALTRIETPPEAGAPESAPRAANQAVTATSTQPRATTVAYSPEESATARAALVGRETKGAQPQPAPETPAPAFSPSRPSSLPPLGAPARVPEGGALGMAKRQTTVAYSPEESAQVRRALEQARGNSGVTPAPVSGTSPTDPAPPQASGPQPRSPLGAPLQPSVRPAALAPPNGPALRQPTAMPPPALAASTHGAPPSARPRQQTMAYSPDESASARAQLLAAQATQASNTQALPPPRTPQELFGTKPAILVTLGSRDEEPSPSSPLTYRERSYFGPPSAKRAEIERALRDELDSLRRSLLGQPRGQYINLAVFDHAFHARPERPPVATLQWKDWRGEPTLSWGGSAEAQQWQASSPQQPVKASFFPDSSALSSSSAPPFPELPRPGIVAANPQGVSPKPQPVDPFPVPAALAQQPVPVAPAPAPAGGASRTVPQIAPAPLPSPAAATQVAPAPLPSPAAATPGRPRPQAVAPFFAAPTPHGVGDHTGDQDKRLAIAFEASQDLYFLATPAEGLDFAVKLLQELVPCEAISGCIYDINTDEFRFVAVSGVGADERRAAAVPSTAGLFSVAVRSGLDSLVIRDVTAEPRYDPEIDGRTGLTPREIVFFALHRADHLLGMLQLINRRERGFSDGDLAVGGYVAHQMTEFLRSRRGLG